MKSAKDHFHLKESAGKAENGAVKDREHFPSEQTA